MACDIHSFAEKREGEKFVAIPGLYPFESGRDYSLFGWLADVRNYSAVPPIAPCRGVPEDASVDARADSDRWGTDGHSHSWLRVEELNIFDYTALVEDRRVTRNGNGGCTCDPGEGKTMTWREFLGKWYFDELAALNEAGAERIVFWFDN
jgi:hypothetical protein